MTRRGVPESAPQPAPRVVVVDHHDSCTWNLVHLAAAVTGALPAVESTPRGVYAGAFGMVSASGRADLGVLIRSLVARATPTGYRYELGTGGGITVYSDVRSELAETTWKSQRLRSALRESPAHAGPPRTRRRRE